MSYVLRRLKKHGVRVFFVAISTIIRSTFALGMAGYSKYVFDGIESRSVTFGNVLILGLLVTAWGAVGLFLKNISIDSLVSRLSYDMRCAYMESVVQCSTGKLKDMGEGRILTDYSQNIGAVMDLVRSGLELVTIPFEMIISLIYLYYCNWMLATVVLITFPIIMLSGKFIGNQIQKIRSRSMMHEDNVMNLITRIVKGIEVIKVHSYQQPMLKEFQSQIHGQLELDLRRAKYNGVFPSPANFSACFFSSSGTSACLLINKAFPPANISPSITAESPLPGSAVKSVTSNSSIFWFFA